MVASIFPTILCSIEETIVKKTSLDVIIDKHGVKKLAEEVWSFFLYLFLKILNNPGMLIIFSWFFKESERKIKMRERERERERESRNYIKRKIWKYN